MYLALASYIANGEAIVQNDREAQQILSLMESLFWQQGFLEYSSGALFEDYLAMGMGQAPLVMIYEAQFIAQAAIADGGIQPDMVLMYPEPTIFTEHILVPLREGGARLGELLKNDPELIQLEIEHGFRNNASARFRDYVQEHNLPVPDTIVNVIEPPSYEMLEGTILCLELSLCSPSP
jgi:hypothetical protein